MATNIVQLEAGQVVENAEGTSNNSSTWKQYYERQRAWPSTCVSQDCNKRATDGAHVKVHGKGGVFILPLCHPCNSEKKGYFPVDKSVAVKLVPRRA